MKIVKICRHCGKTVEHNDSVKCQNCGMYPAEAIEAKTATAMPAEYAMDCAICENSFPVFSPKALPICPSCKKSLRLLIGSLKQEEAHGKQIPL
ncbi:hypothetical protein B7993_08490 [Fibrobacter sp. UWH3]|nr:hypothetical protein B7993_08490 [Fibrobacter sp. UWH3]